MKEFTLTGQKRTDLGKKASKALRKEGLVPCNLYGEKKDENGNPVAFSFAIPMAELRKVIYTPHIYIIRLNIEGEEHTAVMREQQFHPVSDALLHVDFYEINESKPVTVGIPVKLVGLAQGVRDGGRMNLSIRKINVTALKIGKSIKVGELSFEGLEIATPKEVIVCSIKMTRAAQQAAAAAAAAAE